MRAATRLGIILMLIGAALATAIAATIAWADFEGLSYFETGAGYPSFDGLTCPSVMSLTEEALVAARFSNPTDVTIEPNYRLNISGKTEFRRLAGKVTVPPHGHQDAAWTVNSDDIDLGYFILLRLTVLPTAKMPTRAASCGILALDLGSATGDQALTLAVALSALLMAGGLIAPALLLSEHQRLRFDIDASTPRRRATQAMGVVCAAAVLPALSGAWLAAWLLCVVGVLLLLIVLRDAFA